MTERPLPGPTRFRCRVIGQGPPNLYNIEILHGSSPRLTRPSAFHSSNAYGLMMTVDKSLPTTKLAAAAAHLVPYTRIFFQLAECFQKWYSSVVEE